ncbi:MOSC domain-containing protein [Bacillus marinisedimentorum]|uniref:MOSC domain-containing protein n=1 Tax=Bacillus marinisedimentorum TaxID=1821260 RepID=UPI0008733379|nr:MOSC domain-containing protein [Bacillus marinisedimentorum]
MKKVEAVLEALLIADDPDTFVSRRIEETVLEFGGIRGDRHFGTTYPADVRQPMYPKGTEILNRRQISILSAEEMKAVALELDLPEIKPEWLGANMLLKGINDLTMLPAGSRILFSSGAGIVCESINLPCTLPGAVIQKQFAGHRGLTRNFVPAAKRRRGIVGSVERPGPVKAGEPVVIYVNTPDDPMQ